MPALPSAVRRTGLTIGLVAGLCALAAAPARAFEDAPDPTAIRLTDRAERGVRPSGSVEARDARFKAVARVENEPPVMDRDARLDEEAALLQAIDRGDRDGADAQWQRIRDRNRGHEALAAAACAGRIDLVKALLAHGADADHVARRGKAAGWTALAAAVLRDDPLLAHFLLQAGADPDARASNGATPLALALELGRERVARELLQGGADPALRAHGRDALAQAAQWGRASVIELLVQRGADPNERDESGQAPLQIALAEQQAGAVRALLRAGADPQAVGLTAAMLLRAVEGDPPPGARQ